MSASDHMTQAALLLRAGGLVAFPTETVYGLGADAKNEAAIRRIFTAKKRPFDHPLIVHIDNTAALADWASAIPDSAYALAKAFWPGPLTLILHKQPHVLDIVTGQQSTVGIRIPAHPMALALLRAFGSGVVAPSANVFTHVSPTTAAAVREELADRVDLILDGGACAVGLESTILDLTQPTPVILRPGAITAKAIEDVLGTPVHTHRQDTPTATRAPGMHHLHYAPTTTTVLINADALSTHPLGNRTAVITHSDITLRGHQVRLSADPALYAHDLYQTLRDLDHGQFDQILVEAVPETPAWEAIRDRLGKASASK